VLLVLRKLTDILLQHLDLHFKPVMHAWFLVITSVHYISISVCVCPQGIHINGPCMVEQVLYNHLYLHEYWSGKQDDQLNSRK